MSAIHRIRRQRWQVRAGSAADAFAVRALLRRENEASLLPAIEAAFAACDTGRDIRLPRLEIKLGISSLENLADELPARLAEAVRLALSEDLAGQPGAPTPAKAQPTPASRLHHYLLSGQLEWFDADRESALLREQLAAEARQWSSAPSAIWPALRADLPAEGAARSAAFFRLLQLLDDDGRRVWWDFAVQQAAQLGDELSPLILALRQTHLGRPADSALRLQALAMVLLSQAAASSPSERAGLPGLVQALAGLLVPLSTVDRKNWQKIEAWVGEQVPVAADQQSEKLPKTNREERATLAPESDESFENPPDFPVDCHEAPGLPLRSAGLVLLHPYLPRLFAALGWVAERHPAGEPFPWASLPRAAALLNWLATGREEPLEFELGTVKLLLGLRPDDALPVAKGLLGDAEREEGGALLAAVLEHWPALGKTSTDGLRLAFLQRGGLLYPAADGWLLRPQTETYDILLDRLPWGISIARLPWMNRNLHIEWTRS